MADTIHRNFKTVDDAEAARSALLEAGFHASAVQLNLHNTHSTDTSTRAVDNIFQSLTPDDADDTDHGAPGAQARPAALLSIDIDTDTHREQANTISLRYGGTEA